MEKCTADDDIYGTGLTEHKLFRHTSATIRMDWKEFRRFNIILLPRRQDEYWIVLDRFRIMTFKGKGIPNYKLHGKILNRLHLHLIKYIDMNHVKVKKLACCDPKEACYIF